MHFTVSTLFLQKERGGSSLTVQWLRLCLPMQGVWVRSLIEELRSHTSHGQNTKTENRNNIVTNLVKTLKGSTSKKILKKKKLCLKKKRDKGGVGCHCGLCKKDYNRGEKRRAENTGGSRTVFRVRKTATTLTTGSWRPVCTIPPLPQHR